MEQRIIDFIAGLRSAGVRISIAESADAFRAIETLGVQDRERFRVALRTTLVKESFAVGGIGVAVGGIGVAVGGIGVAVGGIGVAVGGIGVAVGGIGVAVGGIGVAVGGIGVAVIDQEYTFPTKNR